MQLGEAWALLKAGCAFRVRTAENQPKDDACVMDDKTIWLDISARGFMAFEDGAGELEEKLFYLPTTSRLRKCAGSDWY